MIYFDNAATTRALPEVAEKMTYMLCENFGNPASVSVMGLEVEKEIRKAAEILANGIRAKEEEIFFTSGGTEGDNWAIYGTVIIRSHAVYYDLGITITQLVILIKIGRAHV